MQAYTYVGNMNTILRANRYWLFAVTLCSPITGLGFFITGFTLKASALIYAAIPLMVLIPATVTVLWLYATGRYLYKSKQREAYTYRTFRLFGCSMMMMLFYACLLSVVLLCSVEEFFSFHHLPELLDLEMQSLFHLSVVLLPLHALSVMGSWYGMHFVARHMDTDEDHRVFSPAYFRDLALLFVIPFGLFKLHEVIRERV